MPNPAVLRGASGAQNYLRARQIAASSAFREIEALPTGAAHFAYEEALHAVTLAQAEAERVLAQARAEAERVREQSRTEAAETLAAARAHGYRDGHEQAQTEFDAAVAHASAAHVEQIQTDLRQDLAAFCDAVIAEQRRAWDAAESQLADLALDIAGKVVKAELSVNPDVVVQITRHALRRLQTGTGGGGGDHLRVLVNPDDVERLRERRDELMTLFEGIRHLDVCEDRRVGIGGVRIETGNGVTLDARVETQLAEIGRNLGEAA